MRVLTSNMNIMHIQYNRFKSEFFRIIISEVTTKKTEGCIFIRVAIFKQRISYIVDRSNLVTLPLFFSFFALDYP